MDELADRIVALGVGIKSMTCVIEGDPSVYLLNKQTPIGFADKFTHSWEVAGALMEKCKRIDIRKQAEQEFGWYVHAYQPPNGYGDVYDNNAAHAIILACVEALEAA